MGFWLAFFCLTFQLACCCGTAACSLCCKCCPKIKQSTSTRFMYALYFILVTIICCVMMSTTVANEMKTHVSNRDVVTPAPGRRWGSLHGSLCMGVLPQKRQSISSTHPLPNPEWFSMLSLLIFFSLFLSPIEYVSQQEEPRPSILPLWCRNPLQWTHPRFAVQAVSQEGQVLGNLF